MTIRRETLRLERLACDVCQQVTIEGECALAGSMRDAVTVLSVQAQTCISKTQALAERIAVKGRVSFQVLYTQGDLTRIRAIETTCDFAHELSAPGCAPGMRVEAHACVQETNGAAASGRMTLGALLEIAAQAYQTQEIEAAAEVAGPAGLCTRNQTVTAAVCDPLGEETALVRQEFDLPQRLQTDGVLTATGVVSSSEITGGGGRIGVSGAVQVHVLHQAAQQGEALVETTHELPFQVTFDGKNAGEEGLEASAQVVDVVADSAMSDKQRTLRVEAEVLVRLCRRSAKSAELLEDLYSTQGPILEPRVEEIELCLGAPVEEVRESMRIAAQLPPEAPAAETVLAAFAQPILSSLSSSGRRTGAEGVMNVTIVYLPVDSDIPCAVKTREPFSMTFPLEGSEHTRGQLQMIECAVGPATSDRVELRCVLALRAQRQERQLVHLVTEIVQRPEEKTENGFVLVWPAPGESRWDTARRLRVPQESLRPAGANALLAFRRQV